MLWNTDCRLLQSKKLRGVLPKRINPNLLHEIGRLREITFREVGEGTNESIDLDKFDQYYHLFMGRWCKKIAGAYRMGLGSEIYPKHGIEGFIWMNFSFWARTWWHDAPIYRNGSCLYQRIPAKTDASFLALESHSHYFTLSEHKFLGVLVSAINSLIFQNLWWLNLWNQLLRSYIAQYVHPRKPIK
jgi:hypothetical protein